MTLAEIHRLAAFDRAKRSAPRWNGTSKRAAKSLKKCKDIIHGRYISQRGFAKI